MSEKSERVTTLLRRYFIKPDGWDEFLETWRKIIVLRQRYGFEILFAFADRELNVFTWAIRLTGDLDEIQSRYYKDPERVALEIVANWVTDYEIREIEPVAFL